MAAGYGCPLPSSKMISHAPPDEIPMPRFLREEGNGFGGYNCSIGYREPTSVENSYVAHLSACTASATSSIICKSKTQNEFVRQKQPHAAESKKDVPANHVDASNGCTGAAKLPTEWQGKTCVVVANVPKRFTQEMFAEVLRSAGFARRYNYLYMSSSRDAKSPPERFAYLNFVDDQYAYSFKCKFDSHFFGGTNGAARKPLSVRPATLEECAKNGGNVEESKAAKVVAETNDGVCVVLDYHKVAASEDYLNLLQLKKCQAEAPSADSKKEVACSACGFKVGSEHKFCRYCGAAM
eukprot:TRINITY_DN14487_c0_g6_i1.p1 TRINITY_DN14487_c0_g6~~TRINITY_DN14487_c0_g6_i1.p1  ORF type:complete len:295 (-),score=43.94 TRINITY_DN14487_c0_g6_i1:180-1064(-)